MGANAPIFGPCSKEKQERVIKKSTQYTVNHCGNNRRNDQRNDGANDMPLYNVHHKTAGCRKASLQCQQNRPVPIWQMAHTFYRIAKKMRESKDCVLKRKSESTPFECRSITHADHPLRDNQITKNSASATVNRFKNESLGVGRRPPNSFGQDHQLVEFDRKYLVLG